MASEQSSETTGERVPTLRIVGRCDRHLWGLDCEDRLARAFGKAGAKISSGTAPTRGTVVLVRAEMVLELSLVKNLVARSGVLLAIDRASQDGKRAVAAHVDAAMADEIAQLLEKEDFDLHAPALRGIDILSPNELACEYNSALRKREPTYVLSLTETPLKEAEERTFAESYKGVTDFVTKYLWPRPAKWVTRWAAEHRITPNMVTTVSLILVFAAMCLFYEGRFVSGIVLAWLMTFLDTVDGKLARVTMTSSPWGSVYDHGIDLIHPPFWWAAWWCGLTSGGYALAPTVLEQALWVILIGYVAGRIMEGFFIVVFGVEMYTWRPADSYFRLITARRNPNLALLTLFTVGGRPDLGFLSVAAWTLISLAFHGLRTMQTLALRLQGKSLESWLAVEKR